MSLSEFINKMLNNKDRKYIDKKVESIKEDYKKESRRQFLGYIAGIVGSIGITVASYITTNQRVDQTNQRIDYTIKEISETKKENYKLLNRIDKHLYELKNTDCNHTNKN